MYGAMIKIGFIGLIFLCVFAYANANRLNVKSACEYSISSHTASVTVFYKKYE